MRSITAFIVTASFLFPSVSAFSQKGCDPELRAHVYDKEWLRLKKDCLSVKGTIYTAKREDDGNVNIRLSLDPGQEKLINEKNISEQFGCLLVVPICVGTVTFPNAIDACEGFENKIVRGISNNYSML